MDTTRERINRRAWRINVSRTDILIGENKLGELERGKVLWRISVFIRDIHLQFVVKLALIFGHVLERPSIVVRKGTTTI